MPAYQNELNAIYDYLNGNPEARRLVKYRLFQIQKGIKDVEYYEPKKQKLQTQLELPF